MDYRDKDSLDIIRFPKGLEEEDRGGKECCCEQLKLASLTDDDQAINDITGVYDKMSNMADTLTFKMYKCGTAAAINNLGTVGTFPNQPLGVGFIYDWRQILLTYGIGTYKIYKEYTISGVTGTALVGVYELKAYSIKAARGTVRLYSNFNSYFLPEEFDFTGSNFADSIRFNGFFGERKPNTQINQLIDIGRRSTKTTRENLNKYELVTDPVLECITKPLLEFFFLNEDETFVTDHNKSNHSYQYFDKPVVIEEEPDVEYIKRSRYAIVKAVFGDRTKKDKSYYNVKN